METSENGVPPTKLSQFYRVLIRSRVSLISALFIALAFSLVPQGQDTLRAMAESSGFLKAILFEGLLVMWAIAVWYGARILLDHDFKAIWKNIPARRARSAEGGRTDFGENFIPRAAACGPIITTGITMCRLGRDAGTGDKVLMIVGALNICLAIALYWFFKRRFEFLEKLAGRLNMPKLALKRRTERIKRFADLDPWLRTSLVSVLVISIILWLASFIFLQEIAYFFGPPAIVVLGVLVLTVIAEAAIWLSDRAHFPIIFAAIVLAGVFSLINDNHRIREAKQVKNRDNNRIEEEFDVTKSVSAQEHVRNWLKNMNSRYSGKEHPLFIVSASGGGIRAAYWTAVVLGEIQDRQPSFAEHIAVISPVSGGTLGSLVFANLVRYRPDNRLIRRGAEHILSDDYLSPVLAGLFFHDIPARFMPYGFMPDRAEALEEGWERGWDTKRRNPDSKNDPKQCFKAFWEKNTFAQPFSNLTSLEKNNVIPMFIINGTSVFGGNRLLTTHLNTGKGFPNCTSLFCVKNNDIPMSTAAHMSARFTYVSPPGTIRNDLKVVDAGYFDNSGATTAMQFYNAVNWSEFPEIKVYFIQIDNDYQKEQRSENSFIAKLYPEIQAPIRALLNVRVAHARNAEGIVEAKCADFKKQEPEYGDRCFNFNFGSAKGNVKAPLGWYLSSASCETIKNELPVAGENSANTANGMKNIGQIETIVGILGRDRQKYGGPVKEVKGADHDKR
jgi:hypothetical protein